MFVNLIKRLTYRVEYWIGVSILTSELIKLRVLYEVGLTLSLLLKLIKIIKDPKYSEINKVINDNGLENIINLNKTEPVEQTDSNVLPYIDDNILEDKDEVINQDTEVFKIIENLENETSIKKILGVIQYMENMLDKFNALYNENNYPEYLESISQYTSIITKLYKRTAELQRNESLNDMKNDAVTFINKLIKINREKKDMPINKK